MAHLLSAVFKGVVKISQGGIHLKPGIHDTSFTSKSPFMKTWIKQT